MKAIEKLAKAIAGDGYLVFDGGMGTMLQARGVSAPDGCIPDLLNILEPEVITEIQAQYVAAGSDVIITNTFSSNALKLAASAVPDEARGADGSAPSVAQLYDAAVRCARAAGAPLVAADIGPLGTLLEPMGTLTMDEAYEAFAEQVRAAVAAGADLIIIETMADMLEAKAALLAAKENSDLPVIATMTFGAGGRTYLGASATCAAVMLSSMGADLVGVNCSLGPRELLPVVREVVAASRVPVIVQPNAGLPRVEDGQTVYDITVDEFAAAIDEMLDMGISAVGGCCGTNPDYIRAIRELVDQRGKRGHEIKRPSVDAFAVTSAQEAVILPIFEADQAVVGTATDPADNDDLRDSLAAEDYDDLVDEAYDQQDDDADIVDIKVSAPGLDETVVLPEVVRYLQTTVSTPLQLRSSDAAALERACRCYSGKPLVCGVDATQGSLESILPLVKKYGASVVGRTADEDGVPATAEARVSLAQQIVDAAQRHGVARCDIVIDCSDAGADGASDQVAEETAALLRERISGVAVMLDGTISTLK